MREIYIGLLNIDRINKLLTDIPHRWTRYMYIEVPSEYEQECINRIRNHY